MKVTGDDLVGIVGSILWLMTGIYSLFVDGEEYINWNGEVAIRSLDFVPWLIHVVWYGGGILLIGGSLVYLYESRDEIANWINKRYSL